MMRSRLADKECTPCKAGTLPLAGTELKKLYNELRNGWRVVDYHHLEKDLEFKHYLTSVAFTQEVAELAEKAGHHPDITLSYDELRLVIYTHEIDGLHENDFILAAKIDRKIEEYRDKLKA